MARFDRYMLSQLLILFGFFSLVLVSVYWVNRAIGLFDQLISDGQTALVFLEFTLLTLPYVILIVLPISAFVAAVYVTNRLSSDSEMVVLQTAGASSLRIGRPVIYFGVLVAVLVAVLAHVLVPAARTELAGRSQEISKDITAQFLKEGQFLHPTSDIAVYIRNITELGELDELFLEDSRDPTAVVTYTAERAFLVRAVSGPRLVMRNGLAQTFHKDTGRLSTVAFEDFAYNIGALIGPSGARNRDLRELSTPVLLNPSEADLASAHGDLPDFLFEAHDRFAKSLLAIVVPLMGFATLMLGGFSRFGVWRQVVIAVVLIILVQMVSNVAEEAARKDAALFWLAYAAPAVGALISALLLYSTSMKRMRGRTPKGIPA
ncbi:lipopolysaccharide export system permease protein [Litoreibacter ascidiaceicola]|uniref:Lipopolysaccharide export system permease protein n=1 Tax=Litoreibacter ascidiaceicola TaxID=1486859 RepID=A0A1M4VHT9_9RHOB|nr:LPS export ABC transporter permease LptF [Litoreibacter ascidiaceicola]SHE68518.1 lipopolysaccharide export system permease protein [Litoreibacter ascidiaceicola]